MKIQLYTPIHEAIFDLAMSHKIEWTAYGKVKQTGRNRFQLDDLILPYQMNSTGGTEIPTEVKEKNGTKFDATLEWRTRNRVMKKPDTWRGPEWNVWIHSHNTMQAFWSGTDWEEINNMMKERNDPFVCIVINAKREYKAIVGIPTLDMTINAEIESNEPSLTTLVMAKQKEREAFLGYWKELIEKTTKLEEALTDKFEIEPPSTIISPTSYYDGRTTTIDRDFEETYSDWNYALQCSYINELAKDNRTEDAADINLTANSNPANGWYECTHDLIIVRPIATPFQGKVLAKNSGNIIAYFDDFLEPIGIYSGYEAYPQLLIKSYDELFPTNPNQTTGLPFSKGLDK